MKRIGSHDVPLGCLIKQFDKSRCVDYVLRQLEMNIGG